MIRLIHRHMSQTENKEGEKKKQETMRRKETEWREWEEDESITYGAEIQLLLQPVMTTLVFQSIPNELQFSEEDEKEMMMTKDVKSRKKKVQDDDEMKKREDDSEMKK